MADPSSSAQYMEYMIEGKKKKSVAKLVVSALIVLAVLTGCAFGTYSYGKNRGHAAGYDEGYYDGYAVGRESGIEVGNKEGYSKGYTDGYDIGYDDGLDSDGSFDAEKWLNKYAPNFKEKNGVQNQFDLTDDEIDAAAKAARDKTEENYAEYADIIADGYKTN